MKTKKEIEKLRWNTLYLLEDDEGSTDYPHLSFECGVLAALDWLVETDSLYAQFVEDMYATDPSAANVHNPEFIAKRERRIKAEQRVAWDVYHSIGDGDPETFYCDAPEEELPYILEACAQLKRQFARRAALDETEEG